MTQSKKKETKPKRQNYKSKITKKKRKTTIVKKKIYSAVSLYAGDKLNPSPVIGMLTLPVEYGKGMVHSHSYLPQSCVKWIEQCGARVCPIQYDLPRNVTIGLLEQCNGLVTFGTTLSFFDLDENDKEIPLAIEFRHYKTFIRTLDFIYLYIASQNMKGNYYPILGLGEGAQMLAMAATFGRERAVSRINKDDLIEQEQQDNLSRVNAQKMGVPIKFTSRKSWVKKLFTSGERRRMAKEKIMFTNHLLGFLVKAPYMKNFTQKTKTSPTIMQIDSVAKGKKGGDYVQMFSFKHLPLFGWEFLPQIIQFEWRRSFVPHTKLSEMVSRKLAHFFVDQCRRNLNNLVNHKILIYNYTLYGALHMRKILNPHESNYKYFEKPWENSYYFNVVKR